MCNGYNVYSTKYEELHFKIFEFIADNVKKGRLKFLTSDIIFEEWERNKAKSLEQVKQLHEKERHLKQNITQLKSFLNDADKPVADEMLAKALDGIAARIQKNEDHIKAVEQFLQDETTRIAISDAVHIAAAKMAKNKMAPFIGDKKNSMADALILLSSLEYVERELKVGSFYMENYFVSSNKGDFSAEDNPKQIHPDLAPFLQKTDTVFYYSLIELVKSIEEEFLSEDEQAMIDSHFSKCPACDFEYGFSLELSDPYKIYDPNKEPKKFDPNQLHLGLDIVEETIEPSDLESEMIEAHCDHCNTDFFECCGCGELNEIRTHNAVFACEYDCGYFYFLDTDIDRKGMIHGWEIRIVAGKVCQKCGERFIELNDAELCEDCENEYHSN